MRQPSTFRLLAALAMAVEVAALAQPAPKTRVTYSEAYGKTGTPPEVTAKDMPRFPAVEPANAAATFQVKKGFRLELVAAEPLVNSPVTMAFDEHGRLFVVEMIDYSERRDETPHAGRIRLLEDTDGDGKFDKSTVFADNLPWPTAVICYGGGIFVGATPDILWLKDTNGDGKADERKVVFTGFGSGAARLNVQALINSLNWGLDNRIHGATGPIGGNAVKSTATNAGPALDLRGRDFSFDPRSMGLQAESGGGQYGLSFDSLGRKFVCSNSDHLQMVLFGLRYGARNPAFAMPNPRISIAADGPAAEVFRLSPDEPWRIVRTRWRISGVVPGMVEGGGRVSGYFTGATGATIYRGDAYGPDFADNAFIGDAGGNLVHRKKIYPAPDGVGFVAKRPDDEQDFEFLASTDTWFRPVQFQNAPDGCLYIADMYREVIEHPWSIPESIKQHIDLNSGSNRGRIWRIVPERMLRRAPADLGKSSVAELVKLLEHPNGWHRETAARLLTEKNERGAATLLEALLVHSKQPLARLHALQLLADFGALNAGGLERGLKDDDAHVREHSIRLAEPFLQNSAAVASLDGQLLAMTEDPSLRVRFQLALTLREVVHAGRADALARIAREENRLLQAAVLNVVGDDAAQLFPQLKGRTQQAVAELIGARNRPAEIERVIETAKKADAAAAFALIHSLAEGLQRAGSSLAKTDAKGALQPLFAQAARTTADVKAPEATRISALQLLGSTSYVESGATLLALLGGNEPATVQSAALTTLARFTDPAIGGELTKRWGSFSSRLKSEALTVLLARQDRAATAMAALEKGTIKPAELSAAQLQALLNHGDLALRARARRLLGSTLASRDSVVKAFMPALQLRGDAARGKLLFTERCATCHRAGKEGFALGPDLVTVKNTGAEKLLVNILDPNREVAPQFLAFNVETKDDESLAALIANETTTHVTLRMASGVEKTLPRTSIRGMKSSGQSLMPEGLEAGLTPAQFADLLEFILTLK